MSTLRKCWEKLKKVPILGWLAFLVVALAVGIWAFFRGRGQAHNHPQTFAPTPRVTPEQGEEIKAEISEKAETEREKLTEEQDEIGDQVDEWLNDLK